VTHTAQGATQTHERRAADTHAPHTRAMASDRQGYTPYGYGMDVPVLVRSTVSYGRGWQLLRSRGAGANATGPCDPLQSPTSCNCSMPWRDAPPAADDGATMPRCVASRICKRGGGEAERRASSAADSVAILFVLDGNRSTLRFYFGGKVASAYASQLKLLVRAVLSLQAVQTTLPIRVLVSGERFAQAESRLAALGVGVLADAPPVSVPTWASKWAMASFAKVRALALTQFERLVVLDNDVIVLRNIDHLASFSTCAAPAFVFGYKCYPRRELRAALMVLQPSRALWTKAQHLLRQTEGVHVYDDNGEGSVWRNLYDSVQELPASYAALRSSDFAAADWPDVHVLHDPNLLRGVKRQGFKEAKVDLRIKELDAKADAEMKLVGPIVSAPTGRGGRAAGRGSRKRGRRRGRRLPMVVGDAAAPAAAASR